MSRSGWAATRRLAASALVTVAIAAVTGCAADPDAPDAAAPLPKVVVGSGDSVVSDLVARFYAGALQRMGTRVTTDLDLGDRKQYLDQLGSGRVTLVPEFTGELLTYYNPDAHQSEPEKVARELSRSLPDGLSVSDYSDTTDWRAVIATTQAVAAKYDVHSVRDLAPHCRELTLGVDVDGPAVAALRDTYGCAFAAVKPYRTDQLAAALAKGEIQAALLPPTRTESFAVAADRKYAIAAENPLPLFHSGALSEIQIKKLNTVAGELSTAELAKLVDQIAAHHAEPAAVAHTWLDQHGF